MTTDQTEAIRRLNDEFRRTFTGGLVTMTSGVLLLDPTLRARIVDRVKRFDDFHPGNDPDDTHDFGSFSVDCEDIVFRIECCDDSYDRPSRDPADPRVTFRVMTIMLAAEY